MESSPEQTVSLLESQIAELEIRLKNKNDEIIILMLALKSLLQEKEKLVNSSLPLEIKMQLIKKISAVERPDSQEIKILSGLNKNIITLIFSFLDLAELLNCRLSNKYFFDLSKPMLVEVTIKKLEAKPSIEKTINLDHIFKDAIREMEMLNSSDITELWSLKSPSSTTLTILDLLALIMDQNNWFELKKKIGGPKGLISALLTFDKDQIINKKYNFKKLLNDTGLTHERIRKTSVSIASFFRWIQGIGEYQEILRKAVDEKKYYKKLESFLIKLEQ